MTGETLKRRLSPIGKTATEWAELLGVSTKSIYRLFKTADVHTDTVERICRALKRPVSFLYCATNDTSRNAEGQEETFTANSGDTKGETETAPPPSPTQASYDLEERVRTLLKKTQRRKSDLCRHIGMTEAGVRRMLAHHSCTNTVLVRMADFFCLPVAELLPYDPCAAEEEEKEREIQFLKGQLEVYRTTIAALLHN